MGDSALKTIAVGAIGGAIQPSILHQAAKVAVRVVARNVGGNLLFLAHTADALQGTVAPSEVFQLPSGASDVFVLAPGQQILAAGQGGGGQISIAVSDALEKAWLSS